MAYSKSDLGSMAPYVQNPQGSDFAISIGAGTGAGLSYGTGAYICGLGGLYTVLGATLALITAPILGLVSVYYFLKGIFGKH